MLQMPLESASATVPEGGSKIKVLIVEKHNAVRRALRQRLSATPHLEVVADVSDPVLVLPYWSGDERLGSPCAQPDVILLGIQNGSDEDLFRNLDFVRQMSDLAATIIVLAPYADEGERLLLQQAGASRYLLKYIDSYRLIREIDEAYRKAHRSKQQS